MIIEIDSPEEEVFYKALQLSPLRNSKKIKQALTFAKSVHMGQLRKSGQPYIVHPIGVGLLVLEWQLDEASVCAALLHDVVEDCGVEIKTLQNKFGNEIASLVDALTKIDQVRVKKDLADKKEINFDNFQKMFLAMSKDVRVILIKLMDRLHNMRTLSFLSKEKQKKIAYETKRVFAPIAKRLGISKIADELFELSEKYLNPWRYCIIEKAIEKTVSHHKSILTSTVNKLNKRLRDVDIEANVQSRHKSVVSILLKMKEKKLKLHQVLDRFGVRIIVNDKLDCYKTLGLLHEAWKPIPGTFKDYIALPKNNGYQSLHTAVLSENGIPIEVQIRTTKMHLISEEGIASHWQYKLEKDKLIERNKSGWTWLEELLIAQQENREDILEHFKSDLFSEDVFVFTKSADLIQIPRGATLLDFAFYVHSNVGLFAKSGIVNGEEKEWTYRLKSGDRIEIKTVNEVQVAPEWLAYVQTPRSRSAIRTQLRDSEESGAIEWGERLLKTTLLSMGMELDEYKQIDWSKIEKKWSKKELLFKDIALVKRNILEIAQFVIKQFNKKHVNKRHLISLPVDVEETFFVKMSKTCVPLPPENIEGEIRPNQGLIIHKKGCSCKKNDELIPLHWMPEVSKKSINMPLSVIAPNQRGVLGKIAALIAKCEADVNNVKVVGNKVNEDWALIEFDIQVKSRFHLNQVIDCLKENQIVMKE